MFDDADISYRNPVTLRELIARNPDLFLTQTWYDGEPFMDSVPVLLPSLPSFTADFVPALTELPSAADLCLLYVNRPDARIWTRYLWTGTRDSRQQPVYIGGKSNTGKLEIHRHLTITSRWGYPVWHPQVRTTEML